MNTAITDKRLNNYASTYFYYPNCNGSDLYYHPDIVSANDYYPFGFQMVGRSFNSPSYKYGFNGKEKDENGMGGGGSTYDYGFRIYNPSIARFLSVDPLTKSYPWYTPYQFAGNKPIWSIDLDGLEEYHYYLQRNEIEGSPVFKKIDCYTITERLNLTTNRFDKIVGETYFLYGEADGNTYSFDSKSELLDFDVLSFDSFLDLDGLALRVLGIAFEGVLDDLAGSSPQKQANKQGDALISLVQNKDSYKFGFLKDLKSLSEIISEDIQELKSDRSNIIKEINNLQTSRVKMDEEIATTKDKSTKELFKAIKGDVIKDMTSAMKKLNNINVKINSKTAEVKKISGAIETITNN